MIPKNNPWGRTQVRIWPSIRQIRILVRMKPSSMQMKHRITMQRWSTIASLCRRTNNRLEAVFGSLSGLCRWCRSSSRSSRVRLTIRWKLWRRRNKRAYRRSGLWWVWTGRADFNRWSHSPQMKKWLPQIRREEGHRLTKLRQKELTLELKQMDKLM